MARTVLAGEAGLRTATTHAWHGQALGDAFTESLTRRGDLTPTERANIDQQARQLRDSDEQTSFEVDNGRADSSSTEEDGQR